MNELAQAARLGIQVTIEPRTSRGGVGGKITTVAVIAHSEKHGKGRVDSYPIADWEADPDVRLRNTLSEVINAVKAINEGPQ